MVKLTLWIDDVSEDAAMKVHQDICLGSMIAVRYESGFGDGTVTSSRIHVIESEIESD